MMNNSGRRSEHSEEFLARGKRHFTVWHGMGGDRIPPEKSDLDAHSSHEFFLTGLLLILDVADARSSACLPEKGNDGGH